MMKMWPMKVEKGADHIPQTQLSQLYSTENKSSVCLDSGGVWKRITHRHRLQRIPGVPLSAFTLIFLQLKTWLKCRLLLWVVSGPT